MNVLKYALDHFLSTFQCKNQSQKSKKRSIFHILHFGWEAIAPLATLLHKSDFAKLLADFRLLPTIAALKQHQPGLPVQSNS